VRAKDTGISVGIELRVGVEIEDEGGLGYGRS
jgi:hypothetical protein